MRNQKSRTPKPEIPLKNEKSRTLNVEVIYPLEGGEKGEGQGKWCNGPGVENSRTLHRKKSQ